MWSGTLNSTQKNSLRMQSPTEIRLEPTESQAISVSKFARRYRRLLSTRIYNQVDVNYTTDKLQIVNGGRDC